MSAVRRRVDGVLLLDKPSGLTSNAALQRVKRLYAAERAGHTGTLDPFATGLLPIALGEATKFSSGLLEADKSYTATAMLGVRTNTGDREGEVIATREVSVGEAEVRAMLPRFSGAIAQVPPMFSALKRDGRPLYEYARAGRELERAPRSVTIRRLALVAASGRSITLAVDCSKGTYIRTLVDDLGEALGCGAHVAELRRTAIGHNHIDAAIALDRLEGLAPAERDRLLLPPDALLVGLDRVSLAAGDAQRLLSGQAVLLSEPDPVLVGKRARLYGADGRFIGVGVTSSDGCLRAERLVRTDA